MHQQTSLSPGRLLQDDSSGNRLALHLASILLLGLLVILVNPRGFIGGAYDDGRYLAAATRWALEGPVLGQNHWALRWPLVLPAAGIMRLAGPDFAALMLPGILSYFALALVNYAGLRSVAGGRAGWLAALGIVATPGIAYWSSALYPDLGEATLWSAAFWCLWHGTHAGAGRRQDRWMIATGVIAGLAFCVRETSVGLVIGLALALLALPRVSLRALFLAGLSAAVLPVAEYAILWAASGDPIYRLHVDLHHVAIPSDDMRGGAVKGQLALLNAGIMERWAGAGPVHWHWAVDTWINFFLNFYYGQNYVAALVLGLWARRSSLAAQASTRNLVPALLALCAANIVWNLYILALNPSDRMFIPTTTAMAVIAALLADRLWAVKGVRLFMSAVLGVKLLSTVIVADTLPDYRSASHVAERIVPPSGPIHVSWQTHSNLALAAPALRRRLDTRPAMAGDRLLLFANHHSDYAAYLPAGRWRFIRAEPGGRMPFTIAAVNAGARLLGRKQTGHADVSVRLFERLPGPSGDRAVVVGADGAPPPPE